MVRVSLAAVVAWFGLALTTLADEAPSTQPASPLAFVVKDIQGNDYDLAQHQGQVVLIVNVASRCGFTKQYEGLEALYQKYKDAGLVVIGFPANDFKGQEPGTNAEILEFCTTKFGVSFPMMAKISVIGETKHPLYKHLTEYSSDSVEAGEIGWNFTKFLIGRDGRIIARFASKVTPESDAITSAVEQALAAEKP